MLRLGRGQNSAFCYTKWGHYEPARKLISGYINMFSESSTSWQRKKQKIIFQSKFEVKFATLSASMQNVSFFKELFNNIDFEIDENLYEKLSTRSISGDSQDHTQYLQQGQLQIRPNI